MLKTGIINSQGFYSIVYLHGCASLLTSQVYYEIIYSYGCSFTHDNCQIHTFEIFCDKIEQCSDGSNDKSHQQVNSPLIDIILPVTFALVLYITLNTCVTMSVQN